MLKLLHPAAFFLISLNFATPALGGDSYVQKTFESPTLGKSTGASIAAGNPEATQTVESIANVKVIGKSLNALTARVENPGTIDIGGTTYTTIYSFGKRIFSDAWFIQGSENSISLGLAPTEIRVPFVLYAIGPVTLNVAAGARFQANVNASLIPSLAIPLEDSTLGVSLMAKAEAGAFVEAYAAVLIIRAGLGGQVDLIDGMLDVEGRVAFNGKDKPVVLVSGMVQFLKGRFYAFLDIFGFFKLGWKRLVDKDLYAWNGICFATGYATCPAK
jgi:hypothetical protein